MELRTEIEIEAPPERVWNVLTDFAAYAEWNPFITEVRGPLAVDSELAVTISPPDSSHYTFKPTVLRCEPNRELRWRGKFIHPKVFQGEHFFLLQATPEGATRFVHGEDFSGLLLHYIRPLLTQTARGFAHMNQALKRRVER